jgi:hypothetical protein
MRTTTSDNQTTTPAGTTCRALVPVAPAQTKARPAIVSRQPAGFLAHLIATQQALPQTRERRRIDPQSAIAIYTGAIKPASPGALHALSRAA